MREYSDKLNWKSISGNVRIDWNIGLLREFADRLHWEVMTNTLFNSSHYIRAGIDNLRLEDFIALIDEFKDRWNWNELSEGIYHPQIEEILEKYASKLNWSKVANNKDNKLEPSISL